MLAQYLIPAMAAVSNDWLTLYCSGRVPDSLRFLLTVVAAEGPVSQRYSPFYPCFARLSFMVEVVPVRTDTLDPTVSFVHYLHITSG